MLLDFSWHKIITDGCEHLNYAGFFDRISRIARTIKTDTLIHFVTIQKRSLFKRDARLPETIAIDEKAGKDTAIKTNPKMIICHIALKLWALEETN